MRNKKKEQIKRTNNNNFYKNTLSNEHCPKPRPPIPPTTTTTATTTPTPTTTPTHDNQQQRRQKKVKKTREASTIQNNQHRQTEQTPKNHSSTSCRQVIHHLLNRKQSASALFVRSSGSPVRPDSLLLTPSPANSRPSAGIPSPGFITTTSPTTSSSGWT